ncbi:MAG: hemerythrin domain-containing protein [Cellulosilyticaceae bacterium]
MKCIEVMKRENKYILKMIDKLDEISMEAHERRKLNISEVNNCIEFIDQYVINYQYIKQEEILFEEMKKYLGQNIRPHIEEILQLHGIGEAYFNQLKQAQHNYEEGKFIAIFDVINNAVTYGKCLRKSMQKEEVLYKYIDKELTLDQKEQIDLKIAYFHQLKEGQLG